MGEEKADGRGIASHIRYEVDGASNIEEENVPYRAIYDAICAMGQENGELPFDPKLSGRFLGMNQYEFDFRRLHGLENMPFVEGLYMMLFHRLIDEPTAKNWANSKDLSLPKDVFRAKVWKRFKASDEFSRLGQVTIINNPYA